MTTDQTSNMTIANDNIYDNEGRRRHSRRTMKSMRVIKNCCSSGFSDSSTSGSALWSPTIHRRCAIPRRGEKVALDRSILSLCLSRLRNISLETNIRKLEVRGNGKTIRREIGKSRSRSYALFALFLKGPCSTSRSWL